MSISCGISSKSSKVLWLASNVWLSFLSSKICCADSTNSVQPDVKFGISSIYNGAQTAWSNISHHTFNVAWIKQWYNASIPHRKRQKKIWHLLYLQSRWLAQLPMLLRNLVSAYKQTLRFSQANKYYTSNKNLSWIQPINPYLILPWSVFEPNFDKTMCTRSSTSNCLKGSCLVHQWHVQIMQRLPKPLKYIWSLFF